jgi:hypothetical protein
MTYPVRMVLLVRILGIDTMVGNLFVRYACAAAAAAAVAVLLGGEDDEAFWALWLTACELIVRVVRVSWSCESLGCLTHAHGGSTVTPHTRGRC